MKAQRAAKQYRCDVCHLPILKGEIYIRTVAEPHLLPAGREVIKAGPWHLRGKAETKFHEICGHPCLKRNHGPDKKVARYILLRELFWWMAGLV